MEGGEALDAINHKAYEGRFARKIYDRTTGLSTAERVILEKLRPHVANRPLLDIGVGGGRTTPFLLELSRDYTAIDYSDSLVRIVRTKYGLDSVYCCDVRDMSRFAEEAFAFVFFSFNGLDYIPHEGRIKALTEINRVLSRGGVLLFSSHNRNSLARTGEPPAMNRPRAPAAVIKRALKAALFAPRRWWLRRHELQNDDYAVRADSGLHYSLLTYYITPRRQRDQLEMTGFSLIGIYDTEGHEAGDQDKSLWLHYLATKPASART